LQVYVQTRSIVYLSHGFMTHMNSAMKYQVLDYLKYGERLYPESSQKEHFLELVILTHAVSV